MSKIGNIFRDSKNTIRTTSTGVDCYVVRPRKVKVDLAAQFADPTKHNTLDTINLSRYGEQIVNDCIDDMNNTGKGYVFNMDQLKSVALRLDLKVSAEKEENMYCIYYK